MPGVPGCDYWTDAACEPVRDWHAAMRSSCCFVQRGLSICVPSDSATSVVTPTSIPTAVQTARFSGAGPMSQTILAIHFSPSRLIVASFGLPSRFLASLEANATKVRNQQAVTFQTHLNATQTNGSDPVRGSVDSRASVLT